MLSPAAEFLAVAVPFVFAGVFWARGLWRDRLADCIAGAAIAVVWVICLAEMGNRPFDLLAACAGGCGAVTLVMSLLVPDRPLLTRHSLRLISTALLIVGFCLSIVL